MEEKKTFSLLVYRLNRALISIFIFPLWILLTIILAVNIKIPYLKWIIPSLVFIGLTLLLIYSIVSRLIVTVENNKLVFHWNKKLLFNYKEIPTIDILEVTAIVFDDERRNALHRIVTRNKTITFVCKKSYLLFKSDTKQFVDFLKSEVTDLKIKDEWDLWAEKGYLIWAYRINTVLLVLVPLVTIIISIIEGGKPKKLLLLFVILPKLIIYQFIMAGKIKKNRKE
ncbi:hypothetical protein [Capnocytophaga cynodegmi]|uniref:hypothetical protein n=1 Tax=Capnocytophaga cynodegmi TaxID=28189 RepID=UPI00037CD507|nr:hypothetical protein [Capnocytophaga cynodegmi]CEN40244.1 conserved membrane hypothetical protein [Capnocytophaga cynodegmi]